MKGYRDWKAGMGRNGRSTGQTGGTMTDIGKVCPETRVVGRSKHMALQEKSAGRRSEKEGEVEDGSTPGAGWGGWSLSLPTRGIMRGRILNFTFAESQKLKDCSAVGASGVQIRV